ncbi:hypothetical protein [Micromonospora sp. NPDC049645]|uniref:hypothetical protein n=1 Tax=Micromonospora sp. NPDC049645 TaxID=3155508 RepID=UPI00343CE877
MVAAATIVQQSTLRSVASHKPWQEQAWEYYDSVGELHSAVGWLGHALSRCKLYVGELPDDATQGDPKPTANNQAQQPLDELFGGPAGHAGMLSRLAVHLSVPGESFVIALDVDTPDDTTSTPTPTPLGLDGQPVVDPGVRRWLVASTDEFEQDKGSGRVTVQLPDSDRKVTVDVDRSTVLRLWRPHARRAWDADSPSRACLDALRELVTCSAHINASLESRLAGAGMLVMPASATIPTNGQDDEPGDELHDDPQYAKLIEAMVTPIGDRDSASAVVPIMVRVDDTSAAKIQYITFATPLDANVQKLREAAIRRLALGLDVPPEVLLGMTDANHWTGWQIEESAVKLSVEPLLTLIVNALTDNYLRPALRALGVGDAERYVIWYDVSELVLRPNRFEQAVALWREGLLGAQAVLREGGFSEQDVPTSAERAEALLVKLVTAGVAPDVARPYLLALGLPAPEATANPGDAPQPEPTERPAIEPGDQQRDPPATPGDPDNPAPAGDAALVAAGDAGVLHVAALELAVLRALELAGKRLLSGAGRSHRGSVTGPAWSIHTRIRAAEADLDRLLDGAYATMIESPVLRRDRALVDGYVRALLAAGVDHKPAYLVAALQQRGDVDQAQAQHLAGRVASYAAA